MKNNKFSLISITALMVFSAALIMFLLLAYYTMYRQNNAIAILEYHNITSDPGMIDAWTVSERDFNDQMSFLNQNCNVVPLRTLLEDIRNGNPIPEHTVAVTFDDGYQSNLLLAYPILEKYRIPATIFVVTKYAQNGTGGEYISLTWAELKKMSESGQIAVESHTHDLHHRVPNSKGQLQAAGLTRIVTGGITETEEQYNQRIESDLLLSRQEIKDQLGMDTNILSWPYGACNKSGNALAKQAGFTYMIGPVGYTYPSADIETVGRIVVPGGADIQAFDRLINRGKVNYRQAFPLVLKKIQIQITDAFMKAGLTD